MESPYSSLPLLESELYAHYVWIRNKLRKINPNGAILYFISKLPKKIGVDYQDWRFYEPWLVFCLIRWTIEEASHFVRKERFDDKTGIALINHAKKFQDFFRLKSECDVTMFMKNLAVQQFWHQQPFSWRDLLIERLLFCDLDKMHSIRKLIIDETGFEPFELLEFALIINMLFEKEDIIRFSIEPIWFVNLYELFPEPVILKYLELMSSDMVSLEKMVCELKPERRSLSVELYDDPVFIEKPLLRTDKHFIVYSPALLVRSATFILRRLIDSKGSATDKQKFQRRFEDLVLKIGNETGKVLLNEEALIALIPGKSVVDFILQDEDVNIFVECKAVEASAPLIRARDTQQLYRAIKSNVFKGLGQGGKCLAELKRIKPENFAGAKKNFLLVVSLSDLFLPFGDLILRCSEKERVDSLREEVGSAEELLGFESISVISVRDFLLLVEMDFGKSSSLAKSMQSVQTNNSTNRTRKMDFAGNFSKEQMGGGILTPMFETSKEILFSRLSDTLKKAERKNS